MLIVNRQKLAIIIIILVVITASGVTLFYIHFGSNEQELNLKRNAIKAYIKNNCSISTNGGGKDASVICN